jgi:hypothetical protein
LLKHSKRTFYTCQYTEYIILSVLKAKSFSGAVLTMLWWYVLRVGLWWGGARTPETHQKQLAKSAGFNTSKAVLRAILAESAMGNRRVAAEGALENVFGGDGNL